MNVVVVESPAKAKTINRYLGPDYTVLASFGHVRDLPAKDGSVRPDDDFAMSWEVDAKAGKRLAEIAKALKGADRLILATDPDREGEAISWHVLEDLRRRRALGKAKIERVVFNAITRSAVTEAMAAPREIDMELVDAYLARRALDYLVGFTLSPVLWRKLPGARSAGRVQSVALRLVVDREREIESFKSQEYWTVEADLTADSDPFTARLVKHRGRRLARLEISDEAAAKDAEAAVRSGQFRIVAVETKPHRRAPPPPFTTSTLQQEASRKLGFSAQRTMQTAQKLYEGVDIGGETVGLITYMRTDGVQSAPEAIDEARRVIERQYGSDFVPDKPHFYKVKAKNSQEAHEAIRPTSLDRAPSDLNLESDMRRLYELIWKRMLASQMAPARIERTAVTLDSADGATGLRASGQVILFPGYLAVYEEGRDAPDPRAPADGETAQDSEARLPALRQGAAARVIDVRADQHFTEAPPRYTEASLVKRLEDLGIGRPSTYASTLGVLRDRGYVRMDRNRFVAEPPGLLVTSFLERFFARYVEYGFTAELEEKLDLVSAGKLDWKTLMREFWSDFVAAVGDIAELRTGQVLEAIDEALGPHLFRDAGAGVDARACPACGGGRLSVKAGRYGPFIGCSNYPECRYTRQIGGDDEHKSSTEDRLLGADPKSGCAVWLKSGRFGPYVEQMSEPPKRASLPKDWPAETIDLERAMRLLDLPRAVGEHPDVGGAVLAGVGRYGPYVRHGKVYANLGGVEEVFDIGLNRAIALLGEKAAGRGGRGAANDALREIGLHPTSGEPIRLLSGRYGPYVKHGRANANLPRGSDPQALTLAQAVELLDARAGASAKRGGARAGPRAKRTGRRTASR